MAYAAHNVKRILKNCIVDIVDTHPGICNLNKSSQVVIKVLIAAFRTVLLSNAKMNFFLFFPLGTVDKIPSSYF